MDVHTIVIYFCLLWVKRIVLTNQGPFQWRFCYQFFHYRQAGRKAIVQLRVLRHVCDQITLPSLGACLISLFVRCLCSLFHIKVLLCCNEQLQPLKVLYTSVSLKVTLCLATLVWKCGANLEVVGNERFKQPIGSHGSNYCSV